jgi:hypothetical protein
VRRSRIVRFAGLALAVLAVASCVGRTRYDEIDGPLRENVIFPDEFGVDVGDLPVDVPAALNQVSVPRLREHVAALEGPRGLAQHRAALRAATYVATELRQVGLEPRLEGVPHSSGTSLPNVVADLPGTGCSDTVFVVGAHYDSVNTTPGADDNASGVAGMLELARVLRTRPLPMTVRFVGFAYEEVGLLGSRRMASQLDAAGTDVAGMVSLEMIGFTAPGDDAFLGVPSDYLATVGDPQSELLARVFGAAHYEYLLDRFAPAAVIDPAAFGDVLRSDHAPFWAAGFPALLVTDTANFRNPNYHQPSDTLASLDLDFLGDSVKATLSGLLAFGHLDDDGAGGPDACG